MLILEETAHIYLIAHEVKKGRLLYIKSTSLHLTPVKHLPIMRVQEQSGAAGEPPEVPPPRGHRAAAARGQAHRLRHPETGGGCLHVYLSTYISIYLSTFFLLIYLSTYYFYLSNYLSRCGAAPSGCPSGRSTSRTDSSSSQL